MSTWTEVAKQLDTMVNQWYETPEIKGMLVVPLTPARLAFRHNHMAFLETTGAIAGQRLLPKGRSMSSAPSGSTRKTS